MMKIERLLLIIIYLLNHKRISASVLANKFEVSSRTIQRDIDTLIVAGIPIISYLGVDGGYEMDPDYKMHIQLSNEEDYRIILTALNGLHSAFANQNIDKTLEKVRSLQTASKMDVVLDFSVVKEQEIVNEHLSMIETCIQDKAVISFTYTNAKQEFSIKKVDPIASIYKWYTWYLIGFDRDKKEYRYYKLIRMNNMQRISGFNEHVNDCIDTIVQKYLKDTREYYDIEIVCKKESRLKVIEYLNGKVITINNDGDYIISLHLPKEEELWKGMLLSFAEEIEIIKPIEVKENLARRAKQFLHSNGDI